jgi:class 3 adenylate cyclase
LVNESPPRQLTVLFADICNSTGLFVDIGDERATPLVSHALSAAADIVARHGGALVRFKGDDVLCTFESSDHALHAAEAIHTMALADSDLANVKITFRIGIHAGPLVQQEGDIFGDTVNTAARLVAEAKSRQTLLSGAVACRAGSEFEDRLRSLGRITARGSDGSIELLELLEPQADEEITEVSSVERIQYRAYLLRLTFRSRDTRLNPLTKRQLLGRAGHCAFTLDHPTISREHAEIKWTNGRFIFRDFSTNGSYVIVNEVPRPVLRASAQLRGEGVIYLGRTLGIAQYGIRFHCLDNY